MLAVDRSNYCSSFPLRDAPQSIGCGQTISAPHMHAIAVSAARECRSAPRFALITCDLYAVYAIYSAALNMA